MTAPPTFETVTAESLVERVRVLRLGGYRAVQISATRLAAQLEVTYSFDLKGQLLNLRLTVPGENARIPSISPVFGCAVVYENEIHDLFDVQVDGLTLDFKGNFYRTAVKFPFGSTKPPAPPAASTAAAAPASPAPAPSRPAGAS